MQQSSFRSYLSVTKPRISILVNFVSVISFFLSLKVNQINFAHGSIAEVVSFHPLGFIVLLISGILSVAGASAFNNYVDQDLDFVMSRTKKRPLPSGKIIDAKNVLILASVLTLISLLLSWIFINPVTSFFIALGVFTYVIIYTKFLKRRNSSNIVIGGFAGSCASLAGWAAIYVYSPSYNIFNFYTSITSVISTFTIMPILITIVIFLWTPSHFWCLAIKIKEDYEKANIPMLPSNNVKTTSIIIFFNTLLLVFVSLLLYLFTGLGILYLIISLSAGIIMLLTNIRIIKYQSKKVAWQGYKFSSLYLVIFLIALLLDRIFI